MSVNDILSHIEAEIARLQQARELIAGSSNGKAKARVLQTGRPLAVNANTIQSGKPLARKKRVLSPEARARIAAAQKKRWANQKAAK